MPDLAVTWKRTCVLFWHAVYLDLLGQD